MSLLGDSDSEDSAANDLDDLVDDFGSLLNIHEDTDHPRPRPSWYGSFGYSHVGKSDPQVKNLGNSWVLDYTSVSSLLPPQQAATSLSTFYQHIVALAAESLANGTTSMKALRYTFKSLSLSLSSSEPISWTWIIHFARRMSELADLAWVVLFDATARNAYWNFAMINIALGIARI